MKTTFLKSIVLPGLLTCCFSGSVESADPAAIDAAIVRGVDFLIEDQNPNGSWGSARQTKGLNIYAPVPGAHDAFRAAVTALCISALCDSGLADEPGEALESLEKAERWFLEELPAVRRGTPTAIYNVWTHSYGIKALVDLYEREDSEEGKAELAELIQGQIKRLERFSSIDGGWGYYDMRAQTARPGSSSISFTTATCLVALKEAEGIAGVSVPEKLVSRAVAALNRQQKPDHSYLYGEYLNARPLYNVNRPAASLGRTQACNFALRVWGDETVTDEITEEWLIRLRDRNGWLDIGRKRPIPHEAWFQVAGYFFYYGHYYAALNIDLLPEKDQPAYQELVADILLPLQEKGGAWWDFPFYTYHKPYGTAYAVMSLVRCR